MCFNICAKTTTSIWVEKLKFGFLRRRRRISWPLLLNPTSSTSRICSAVIKNGGVSLAVSSWPLLSTNDPRRWPQGHPNSCQDRHGLVASSYLPARVTDSKTLAFPFVPLNEYWLSDLNKRPPCQWLLLWFRLLTFGTLNSDVPADCGSVVLEVSAFPQLLVFPSCFCDILGIPLFALRGSSESVWS